MTTNEPENYDKIEVSWVCADCGVAHGTRKPKECTWHEGRCDICGKAKGITQGRDWGVYTYLPKEEFE